MALTLNYATNSSDALDPLRTPANSVGYQLYAPHAVDVLPSDIVRIDTGIIFEMQGSFYGQLENAPDAQPFKVLGGVIDPGYRGSVIVVLLNLTSQKLTLHRGDCVAQILFLPVLLPELIYQEEREISQSDQDTVSENRLQMYVRYSKTHPMAKTPSRFEEGSVGYDLHSLNPVCVKPHSTVQVDTGIELDLQGGAFYVQIRDKSGFATKRRLHVVNGVIDASYPSTLHIHFENVSCQEQHIFAHEPIAQMIFLPVLLPVLNHHQKIYMHTFRGSRGFGSGDCPV